jgi:hypothetical protein
MLNVVFLLETAGVTSSLPHQLPMVGDLSLMWHFADFQVHQRQMEKVFNQVLNVFNKYYI